MKLVGKKLYNPIQLRPYRTGPLKLFNMPGGVDRDSTTHGQTTPGRGHGRSSSGPTEEQKRRQREFQEAMKKKAWLAEQAKQESAIEKKEWKDEASRELYDTEQKGIFDKQKALAEGQGGALQQAGAERGLAAQMAAAGAGRGSSAARMRGMARAGEAGTRAAASMGAQSGAQQAQMLGAAGKGRFGMMKSDKAGKLGFYQKSRGLDVAEKAAEQQAQATRAANSGGKAAGGQIFKEFKRKNGKVEGKGTETSDDIKAMLSDGEFVVNAKTVRGIGESMGADGKEDSRKKGAGFLYDLQTKYGDKKPIGKSAGGFTGMHMAELASNVAKSGALGKEMETVGEVGSAAVSAKKGIDKKKASDLDAGKKKAEMDELKAFKHKTEKASGEHPSKKAFEQMAKGGSIYKDMKPLIKPKSVVREGEFKPDPNKDPRDEKMKRSMSKFLKGGKFSDGERKSHLKMALDMVKAKKGDAKDLYKKMSGRGGYPKELVIGKAKGGHVNLGKGVKAKRKFREAIGWEADKIFDKKAEKDYKEGHTGYKNWKGDSVVKLGRGGLLGSIGRVGMGALAGAAMGAIGGPAGMAVGAGKGAAMGAAKAGIDEKMKADKEAAQKKSNIAMGEAEAAGKTGAAGKAMAADEVQLKKGGAVKKDHPHKAYLEELDKFMAHQFSKGKKVETDPAKKAEKAIKSKKGSFDPIEPYEFSNGQFIDMTGDKPHEKGMKEGHEKHKKDVKKAKMRIGQAKSKKKFGKKAFEKLGQTSRKKPDMGKLSYQKFLNEEGAKRFLSAKKKRSDAELKRVEALEAGKKHDQMNYKDFLAMKEQKMNEKKQLKIRKDAEQAEAEYDKSQKDKAEGVRKYEKGVAKDLGISPEQYRKEMKSERFFGPEEKGRRETKSIMKGPKVKKETSWWGDMPDKDKAGLVFGAGRGLLSARQQYLKEKQAKRQRIAAGERLAGATRAAAANQLIAAPVSLRKGGRVSFKDVLKAKKKMGY